MRIAPFEAEIFGQRFDRLIACRPFGCFPDDITVKIDRPRGFEQPLNVFWCADVRVSLLELAISCALVLRIIIDDCLVARSKIIEGGRESVTLRSWRRFFRKKGNESLGRVVAMVALNEAVEIAHIPQGVDFYIEEQLKRRKVEAHRRAQIRFWRGILEHRAPLE
jgi:hypothetical protein